MLYNYTDLLDIYVFGFLFFLAAFSSFVVAGLVWRKRKAVKGILTSLELGETFKSGDPYFDDVVRLRKQKGVLAGIWVLVACLFVGIGVWKASNDYERLMLARAEVAERIGISLEQFNQGWRHAQFNETAFELTNKDEYPVVFKNGGEPKIWFIAPIKITVDTSYNAFRGLKESSEEG